MNKYALAILSVIVSGAALVVAGYYLRPSVVDNPGWHFDLPNTTKTPEDYSWPHITVVGIAMLIGITFSYLYRRFSDLQAQKVESINFGQELKDMFSATSFYLSLCAAPVVFCVVVAASRGATMLASLFLAFQNGFFWQTVMPKSPPSPTPQREETPSPSST